MVDIRTQIAPAEEQDAQEVIYGNNVSGVIEEDEHTQREKLLLKSFRPFKSERNWSSRFVPTCLMPAQEKREQRPVERDCAASI